MPKSINEILGNEALTENLKIELQEAYETRIAEQREQVTAELREEFAARWDNDKKQIVEGMDAILHDTIKTELTEFAQDKANVISERVKYKKAVKSHAKILETFVNEILITEIRELREDRKAQKANFMKLEEFVLGQLTKELNEFHEDKRSLSDQQVKMVREGKKVIDEARKSVITKSAIKIERIIESVLRKELTSLHEDIQTAKENDFGRKIFETFASEFMTSTLSEGTQVSKLAKQIIGLKHTIAEANSTINEKDEALIEAKRDSRIAIDRQTRQNTLSEMLSPLARSQKELMGTLLESVKTNQLASAYKKYLPSVLNEKAAQHVAKKANTLTESSRVINGDKVSSAQTETGNSANIIELKKLAGLS